MPKVNCCVPLCTSSSKRNPNLSFYRLPKDEKKRKRWNLLCRNANLKTKSKWTSVCSLHFHGGCKSYNDDEPSIFPWSKGWKTVIETYNTSLEQWRSKAKCKVRPRELPEANKLPLVSDDKSKPRSTTSITKRTSLVSVTSTQSHEEYDEEVENPVDEDNVSLPSPDNELNYLTNHYINGPPRIKVYEDTSLTTKDELQGILTQILALLDTESITNSLSKGQLINLLRTVTKLLMSVKEQCDTIVHLRECDRFTLKRFEGSDAQIRFWTGFYSSNVLMAFYSHLLEPHVNVLHYWGSNNSTKKDADSEKCGRKRQLQPIDEMFLTLVKLKQGSANEDLGERFNLLAMDVSRIFITWVHFMRTVLNSIDIWPSKSKIRKYMPDCFKGLYNDVRVIIDCTEIPLEKPSDFECQAATFSMYKHCNTVKALIGISPSGIPTFISDAYEGSISDNDITLKSGLIDKLEPNDAIMADRGFTGRETLSKHKIRLITPHFLSGKDQMDVSKLVESVAIARVRIHVERCMGRIKQWSILSRKVPLTLWKQINEIYQLCALLVLFWPPLLKLESE